MKILIKGTNFKLDNTIYDYIEEKIGGLRKFIQEIDSDLAEARIEVGRINFHHRSGDIFRAEINLILPGRLLRATAEEKDIFIAITTVKDEIQRKIKKYKSKTQAKYKRSARIFKKNKSLSSLAEPRVRGRIKNEGF